MKRRGVIIAALALLLGVVPGCRQKAQEQGPQFSENTAQGLPFFTAYRQERYSL